MLARYLPLSVSQVNRSMVRCNSKMVFSQVKIEIPQGVIVGREELLPNGEPYYSFQGIPYAVPPLGDLRFRSPVPLERFTTSPLDCTQERSECSQIFIYTKQVLGSEDCLYLNVYAPAKSSTNPLPVMVWIHGGAFTFGSSKDTIPSSLICEGVIVVTINYRLGAFGFLNLPEEGIWGNAGLKDQRLALHWIHDNISNFNGDPTNVTIFGVSAGAASVHFHMMAPYAHKLFHKAIIASGSANLEWVFRPNQDHKVAHLCELLGCHSKNKRDMFNFLKSPDIVKSADILKNCIKILTSDEKRRGVEIPFRPVIEHSESPDKFINIPVVERMQQKDIIPMPTMVGYNSGEGIMMLPKVRSKLEEVDGDLARFLPRNIQLPVGHSELKMLGEKLRAFYFNGQKVTPKRLPEFSELLSDYHVVDLRITIKWLAKNQTPEAPTYFYRYDYTGERDVYKKLLKFDHIPGACHYDDFHYLFQRPGEDYTQFEENDKYCVKRLSALWANFARHGNPTPPGSEITEALRCTWMPMKRPVRDEKFTPDCFLIDRQCKMKCNPDKERWEFWEEIYRKYQAVDYSQAI